MQTHRKTFFVSPTGRMEHVRPTALRAKIRCARRVTAVRRALRRSAKGSRTMAPLVSPSGAPGPGQAAALSRPLPDVAAQMRHSVLPLLDFQGRPAGSCSCAAWLPCRSGRQQAPLRLQDLETPVSQCTLAAPDELPPPSWSASAPGADCPSWSWTAASSAGSSARTIFNRSTSGMRRTGGLSGASRRRWRQPPWYRCVAVTHPGEAGRGAMRSCLLAG